MEPFELPKKVKESLLDFYEKSKKSSFFNGREWVYGKEGSVYVRVTKRLNLDHQMVHTLELSSIEIKSKHEGKGVFKSVLDVFEEFSQQSGYYVFIENVLNDKITRVLNKRGYLKAPNSYDNIYWLAPPVELKKSLKL